MTEYRNPDLDRDLRLEVVLKLLDKGTLPQKIEATADRLVNYIVNGKTNDPNLVKKLEVKLPPDETVEANAYLLDDSTIQIEFKNPEMAKSLFENFDLYGLSFYAIPATPMDINKDN